MRPLEKCLRETKQELRQRTLVEFLRKLVETEGRTRAADTMGVNYRTLVKAEKSGEPRPRRRRYTQPHLEDGSACPSTRSRLRRLELPYGLRRPSIVAIDRRFQVFLSTW